MSELRRFGRLDLLALLLVFLAAGGTRVAYLWLHADQARAAGGFRVQDRHPARDADATAKPEAEVLIDDVRNDLAFRGSPAFADGSEESAHAAPGYPWLVGLLGRVLPPDLDLFTVVRWTQAGLGTLTAVFVFFFARRAFRSLAVGTVAGLLAALHPFWIISTATIADGTLAAFALAGCLWLGGYAGEKGGWLSSLVLGGALGGLALVRAAFLPFSFVALVWYLLRTRTHPSGWFAAVCAFVGFGGALAPWTVRNWQLYNEPVPVVSSVYYHLWVGNNPLADGGPPSAKMAAAMDARVGEAGEEKRPTERLAAVAKQPARYAMLGKDAIREIRTDPGEAVRHRFQAAGAYFLGKAYLDRGEVVDVADIKDDDHADRAAPTVVRILQLTLPAMLVLALLGWRWSYTWKEESTILALAAVWVPLPYLLTHAEMLSGARLPFDGVLLVLAAVALCGWGGGKEKPKA